MLGISAVAVAVIAYMRWFAGINHAVAGAAVAVYRFLIGPKFCSVAVTFFNEAAVLWFVFPLLDMIYDQKRMTAALIRDGFGVSGVFFTFAVVLSHVSGDRKGGEPDE